MSQNQIKLISSLRDELEYLNLSHNSLEYFYDYNFEFTFLLNFVGNLRTVDFSNSFSKSISNKLFFFSKSLEFAYFSNNDMNLFPKFCKKCLFQYCNIEIECKLRVLKFDSNNLKKIFYLNLFELKNLEYLNLENNSLSFIETKSFSDLIKLETLILSHNNLTFLNNSLIFLPLSSLKLLNLSSNQIEIIQSNLFVCLFKLETLDLSLNRIRFIENFALKQLINLKNLHLNENDDEIFAIESNLSFFNLVSIQNIYVSKLILNGKNVQVILNLFEEKNKQLNKRVLGISFFKSLFLSSKYSQYDCELTLFFIRKNVHFNFKTESEIFDYFNVCSGISIENSTLSIIFFYNRIFYVFEDFRAYFFWVYLLFVLFTTLYLLNLH